MGVGFLGWWIFLFMFFCGISLGACCLHPSASACFPFNLLDGQTLQACRIWSTASVCVCVNGKFAISSKGFGVWLMEKGSTDRGNEWGCLQIAPCCVHVLIAPWCSVISVCCTFHRPEFRPATKVHHLYHPYITFSSQNISLGVLFLGLEKILLFVLFCFEQVFPKSISQLDRKKKKKSTLHWKE